MQGWRPSPNRANSLPAPRTDAPRGFLHPGRPPVPLLELETTLQTLRDWARAHHVTLAAGMVELSDDYPQVTIRAFEPGDVDLFLLLADQLAPKVLALDAPPFDEHDLELARAFTGRINDIEERAVFNRRVAEARAHLGQVHTLTVVAFTPGLERALVYRAVAAWAEELFGIMRSVAAGDEESEEGEGGFGDMPPTH